MYFDVKHMLGVIGRYGNVAINEENRAILDYVCIRQSRINE